jgi:hypothetical protein
MTKIKQKNRLISRLIYKECFGEIPQGLFVCHTCDNRACINPEHFFLGTAKDNFDDMIRKGRQNKTWGEGVNTAKLKKEQILDIYFDNRKHEYIANEYGVQKSAISKIKTGRTWRRITGEAITGCTRCRISLN